jgi:hypothetical protein
MDQASKMLVIVDPMRARFRRFDAQGQEIIAQRDVFRAASANLLMAIGKVFAKKADVHSVAADYRNQGACCDRQQFAQELTTRLRKDAAGGGIDLAVLVTAEMAQAVNDALHPELTPAVRVFHKVPCCNLPESLITELLADWPFTSANRDAALGGAARP